MLLHVQWANALRCAGQATSYMCLDSLRVVCTVCQHEQALTACSRSATTAGTPEGVSKLTAGDHVVARVLKDGQVLSSGTWDVAAGK